MAEPARRRTYESPPDPQLAGRLALLLTDPAEPDTGPLMTRHPEVFTSMPRLYGGLFEPAARVMGDLWLADECEDWQVTLGMCRLLTLSHDAAAAARRLPSPARRQALVVTQPGEPHLLQAALHAELFWRAGWQVRQESPADDEALAGLVNAEDYDLLDVCLSAAYRRDDWLPRMARTIARARTRSANADLAVMVSGRCFHEDLRASARVGADGCCPGCCELAAVAEALWRRGRGAGWPQ